MLFLERTYFSRLAPIGRIILFAVTCGDDEAAWSQSLTLLQHYCGPSIALTASVHVEFCSVKVAELFHLEGLFEALPTTFLALADGLSFFESVHAF